MPSFAPPTERALLDLAERRAADPFRYPNPGLTRGAPAIEAPAGYRVDHARVRLGTGQEAYGRACAALSGWRMFELGWVAATKATAGASPEDTIAVSVHLGGLWWSNVCRIVYTLREDGPVERFGFAYGTLDRHAERGEERFLVEWNRADDSVWYDLYAVSRPNRWWVWLSLPIARRAQRRFARDSLRAMERAVAEEPS